MKQYIPPKDPVAELDYAFDWSEWVQPGEAINTATVTASGLTLNPDGHETLITNNVVQFWLSAGLLRGVYPVTCLITTNRGRTDERTFDLHIVTRTL